MWSWMSFHEWKLILLYLIVKSFSDSFKFHLTLLYQSDKTNFSHTHVEILFCTRKNILLWWLKYLLPFFLNIGGTMQISRFKKLYSIFMVFRKKYWLCFISQLFNDNSSIKEWHEFKTEYDLHWNSYFQWVQLIDCIPEK